MMVIHTGPWNCAIGLALLLALPVRAADAPPAESAPVQQVSRCGPVVIPGHYGPYDYVTQRGKINIVEQFHFTTKVEALIGGESGYLGGDLSYTLNASPNHLRALVAAMNYALRTKMERPPYMQMSVECYFDRAVRFKPEDAPVRALFAIYLGRLGRMPEAQRQLKAAEHYAGENGFTHHNIGLVYYEFKMYEEAVAEAHAALKYGYPGTQLSDLLKQSGHWVEPQR